MAFGALSVESHCSWAVAELLKPVEFPQVQFLDKVCIGFLGRTLSRLGYVRMAFGALHVEIQCSWTVVLNC